MSAPATLSCALAALVLGLPIIATSAHLEIAHRTAGAADAAALAAADAANGLINEAPCDVAARVAAAMNTRVESCEIDTRLGAARVTVSAHTALGRVTAHARAAPEFGPAVILAGERGPNGWAWPSGTRSVTQGHHDGLAIDLAVGPDGLLYAPFDGTIMHIGADSAGMPPPCRANPGWWRGPNHAVIMRHEVQGRTLFSSHNHISAGSASELGLRPGDPVQAGQAVARSGMSGCTSGPHTHFTLATHATNAFPDVNPYDYLGPP